GVVAVDRALAQGGEVFGLEAAAAPSGVVVGRFARAVVGRAVAGGAVERERAGDGVRRRPGAVESELDAGAAVEGGVVADVRGGHGRAGLADLGVPGVGHLLAGAEFPADRPRGDRVAEVRRLDACGVPAGPFVEDGVGDFAAGGGLGGDVRDRGDGDGDEARRGEDRQALEPSFTGYAHDRSVYRIWRVCSRLAAERRRRHREHAGSTRYASIATSK